MTLGALVLVDRQVAGRDRDRSSVAHRIASVHDKIEKGGLELRRIDIRGFQTRSEGQPQVDGFTAGAVEDGFEPGDQGVGIVELGLEGLPAGEGQQLLREFRAPVGRALRAVDQALVAGIGGVAGQEIEIVDDDRQEIVEIVRDATRELPDGLHLLGLEQGGLSLRQGLLRFPPLGDVAGDLRKTDQIAALIVDRVHDHARPEAGPVLAQAPALVLEPALAGRSLERPGGKAGRPILFRVELREMMPDDLVLEVSLDPLRPGIPVGDMPLRVEHVDGVIGHALHEQPEALLAVLERLEGVTSLGQVPGDLRIADQFALFVADRVDDHMGPEAGAVLAQAPALVLELPMGGGDVERFLREAGGAILVRVELGKVRSEDFCFLVPLEALRPGVPARNDPGRIQHVDGVVGDGIDEELEAFGRRRFIR
jgi:hypothetical protein